MLRASESNGNAIAQPSVRLSTSTPFAIGHACPGPTVRAIRSMPGGSTVTTQVIESSASRSSTSSGRGSAKVPTSRFSNSANACTPRPIDTPAAPKSAPPAQLPAHLLEHPVKRPELEDLGLAGPRFLARGPDRDLDHVLVHVDSRDALVHHFHALATS